ncbi:MAG: hypothetical protein A2287_02780 [Candidatus Melainabacteria bacterium RIFOXYA12_FULL_32_12]|nr:MAG: hypothetical protein A2287_02780 [Candidatus Melainabacteria bacterium RIFOXYA12_FULL_32_12]
METNSASKKFYQSKTFWVNIISLAGLLVQSQTGFIIPAEVQAGILTVINTVLRFTTSEPIQ